MYLSNIHTRHWWKNTKQIKEEYVFNFSSNIDPDWDDLKDTERLPLREPALLNEKGGWNRHD